MEEYQRLDSLKENYNKIQAKYELPSFEKLNEDFSIEKIADVETDILVREVRRCLADKLSNYLRLIETLINPTNASVFVFSIIKTFDLRDRKKLSAIYKELAKMEVNLIELDIEFDEIKEVEFIKEGYSSWQEIKKDLLKIIEKIKKSWDSQAEINDKGYFS